MSESVKKSSKNYYTAVQMPYEIYTAGDANRPVNWRYQRIRYIMLKEPEKQVFLDDDDLGVRYAYQVFQALAQAKTPEERYLCRIKYAGFLEACKIYKYFPVELSGLLEAYVLADEEPNKIAGNFSITYETLGWYEQLFFDARSRLDCPAFTHNQVCYPVFDTTRKAYNYKKVNYDTACAYRVFGYHGGSIVLELFSTAFLSTDAKPVTRDLAVTMIQKAGLMRVTNAGVAAQLSGKPKDKATMIAIKMATGLAVKAQAAGNMEIMQNVGKALSYITPLIGDDAKLEVMRLSEQNAEYKKMFSLGVDVRATDQLLMSRGIELSSETKNLLETVSPAGEINNIDSIINV
jgi:hypothetical protein